MLVSQVPDTHLRVQASILSLPISSSTLTPSSPDFPSPAAHPNLAPLTTLLLLLCALFSISCYAPFSQIALAMSTLLLSLLWTLPDATSCSCIYKTERFPLTMPCQFMQFYPGEPVFELYKSASAAWWNTLHFSCSQPLLNYFDNENKKNC